ncbi:hypothetical protein F0562_003240 [Nyssa sinensis]|uniref:Uncharacterized protein n=1 Tax=Nyssa sinensis TaxID=561372 RepID=A0A5J5BVX3_9ASTE|nr:hypothetical protein F0562_003240 [Nyssa sinensis]
MLANVRIHSFRSWCLGFRLIWSRTESNNPNSLKSVFEFASSDEVDVSKSNLNFGNITRKCRLMKRRRRNTEGNCGVFSGAWNSKISPEISIENRKEYGGKDVGGFTSNICLDTYEVNGFRDFSDHETSATSKEASQKDINEPTSKMQTQFENSSSDCGGDDGWLPQGETHFSFVG